jgi:hypothetical protein
LVSLAARLTAKGSVAIAVALEFPEPAKGGRGKKSSATERFPMVDKVRLHEARLVVRYTPALADQVLGQSPRARRKLTQRVLRPQATQPPAARFPAWRRALQRENRALAARR